MQGGYSHTCEGGAKTQVELEHLSPPNQSTIDASEEEVDERGEEPGEKNCKGGGGGGGGGGLFEGRSEEKNELKS